MIAIGIIILIVCLMVFFIELVVMDLKGVPLLVILLIVGIGFIYYDVTSPVTTEVIRDYMTNEFDIDSCNIKVDRLVNVRKIKVTSTRFAAVAGKRTYYEIYTEEVVK